ncbi:hypothetical protein RFI_05845 [Reticulomyxa filosa]|uniref:Protein kinase domain-containing protein n=1 Tax=Reticulomyxa filosa TaxID=46433 RepID=X6NY77_RETFI|nr:hypothetical protein RFI_05845 [Reticulomyxa filosa]|eukprot:ETO31275.1 hypothetical protein RFI_05845 [Reticulomyxa filosa]
MFCGLTDWNQQMYMRTYPCMFCPKEFTYLRLRVVQKIFGQIVSAVRWLHSKEICHLDLSLENVVIQNNNVLDPQIQLVDFGVAVDFGDERESQTSVDLTKTEELLNSERDSSDKRYRYRENVGKPGYKAFEVRMSDEARRKVRLQEVSSRRALAMKQIRMNQNPAKNDELLTEITMCDLLLNYVMNETYDPFAADVWSLGVILFLLLFCRYPFRHADLDDELFVVILQDRLLLWLIEQKALCWVTVETFDILNQMLKPEYARIDIERLSCHPFCGFASATAADVHGGHASTNTESSTQTATSSVTPNTNETTKLQPVPLAEHYSEQLKLGETTIPPIHKKEAAEAQASQMFVVQNCSALKNSLHGQLEHNKLLFDHSVDEYDPVVVKSSNTILITLGGKKKKATK